MKILITNLNKRVYELNIHDWDILMSNCIFENKKEPQKKINLDDIETISFCEEFFIMEKVDKIIECLLIYRDKTNRKIKLDTYTERI